MEMNKWKTFERKDLSLLRGKEIKTYKNKVLAITDFYDYKLFSGAKEINPEDIGWWREKPDYERFKQLQAINERLDKLDEDFLFQLEEDLSSAMQPDYKLRDGLDDKLEKLFKKLKRHIENSQIAAQKESTEFLKQII